MRAVLVLAAVALLYAGGPAEAAQPKRAQAPRAKPGCAAKAGAARAGRPAASRRGAERRAAARRAARRRARLRGICAVAGHRRVGEATAGRIGIPGALVAPVPFAAAPTGAAPDATAPGTGPAPGDPAGPALPPVYSSPLALQVRAYEFFFRLSKSTVATGNVKVEFNLAAAEDPHNIFLVREDGTGPAYSFGESGPGDMTTKTFPLTAGRWILLCSLTGHEAAGMRSTLTVG